MRLTRPTHASEAWPRPSTPVPALPALPAVKAEPPSDGEAERPRPRTAPRAAPPKPRRPRSPARDTAPPANAKAKEAGKEPAAVKVKVEPGEPRGPKDRHKHPRPGVGGWPGGALRGEPTGAHWEWRSNTLGWMPWRILGKAVVSFGKVSAAQSIFWKIFVTFDIFGQQQRLKLKSKLLFSPFFLSVSCACVCSLCFFFAFSVIF